MPKVTKISYLLDSGSRVDYAPEEPQEIDEETMSAIIKLVDGMDIQDLIDESI